MRKSFLSFHLFLFFISLIFPKFIYAFSLSPINVKSKFGEKFDARIEVFTDARDGLQAVIGSKEDYLMLGVLRPDIVDDIELTILDETADLKRETQNKIISPVPDRSKIIHLTSKKFLFYPSLELIVKAQLDGGTILEKYVLAVDFHREVSVSLFSDEETDEKMVKKQEPIQTALKKKIEMEKEKSSNKIVGTQIENKTDAILIQSKKIIEGERKKSSKKQSGMNTDKVALKTETTDKKILKDERTLSDKYTIKKIIKKTYGPIKSGDNLYHIANRLNLKKYNKNKLVVALWKKNKDKFIGNNMNTLMKGIFLDYTNIEDDLKTLSLTESMSVINKQYNSWKKVPSPLVKKKKKSNINTFPHIYSFGEDLTPVNTIQSTVKQWVKAWEGRDVDAFMDYYSPTFNSGEKDIHGWRKYKDRIIKKYKNVTIINENMEIITFNNKEVYLSFIQKFSSDKMKSIGLKTLKLIKNGDKWLIEDEIWDGSIHKPGNSPFVIHISSVASRKDAEKETKRFKKLGYNAYYSYVFVPEKGNWYRIFIDRFSYRKTAYRLANYIKDKKHSSYALVMKMPYAIDFGTYASTKSAGEVIMKISANTTFMSPYLFIYNSNKNTQKKVSYRVLGGAYAVIEHAGLLSEELIKNNLTYKIGIP